MTKGRSPEADAFIKRQREKPTPRTEKRWKLDLLIEKDVYPTSTLAASLMQYLEEHKTIKEGSIVLDYGCGSGFYAIGAAMLGAGKVVGTDISEQAINCAHTNVELNFQENLVELRQGDTLTVIEKGESFDIIFAGMPWEDAEPADVYEMSFYDNNFRMRHELFRHAHELLTPSGYILTTYGGRVEKLNPFEKSFCEPYKLHCEILISTSIHDEPHFVYNVTVAGETVADDL